jgi:hypothetical protein
MAELHRWMPAAYAARMGRRGKWLIAGLALTGCGASPVLWDVPVSAPGDSSGMLIVEGRSVQFAKPAVALTMPPDTARCQGSGSVAVDGANTYATWLRRRPNGSVLVLAARSSDSGRSWMAPGIVDSVDAGRSGCDHPAPSIAASAGYVHVAYSLDAPEGFGVFFAHSMDQAATFHSAIPVIYGDRLSLAAVAADGMRVVVAYEDPSGGGHRVDVAVSNTQGHSFERRLRGSPDDVEAVRPEVALRGSMLALSFATAAAGDRMLRLGQLQ